MLLSNSYVDPEASTVTVTFREVFRIEHRTTKNGVFSSSMLDEDWFAWKIPMPYDGAEASIEHFIDRKPCDGIFAYLSIKSICHWFSVSELTKLDQASFHVSVFLVSNEPMASAFSPTQVVFARDRAEWVRFISLLDL